MIFKCSVKSIIVLDEVRVQENVESFMELLIAHSLVHEFSPFVRIYKHLITSEHAFKLRQRISLSFTLFHDHRLQAMILTRLTRLKSPIRRLIGLCFHRLAIRAMSLIRLIKVLRDFHLFVFVYGVMRLHCII